MTHRLRSDSGQALVVMVVFMLCLLGGVALTLDVGSWYREHRQAQTTADAAALAAAQFLPNTVTAKSTAQTYADKNGGSLVTVTVKYPYEINIPLLGMTVSSGTLTAVAKERLE